MISLLSDEIVGAMHGRLRRLLTPVPIVGVSIDSRTCQPGELFFALKGDRCDGHDFVHDALDRNAVAAVVQRPTGNDDRREILVVDTLKALGHLAGYHRRQHRTPVIAVTGSNGKTTTQRMIQHVLSQTLKGHAAPKSYNNALGVALTLLSAERGDDYLVVEIGSNAPGEVAALAEMAEPTVGVVTSIGDAHLEGLVDRRGVAVEKLSLLQHLRPGGLAIVNIDDPLVADYVKRLRHVTVVTFGRSESADVQVTDIESSVTETRCSLNGALQVRLPCAGEHNALNAAATFAACRRLSVQPESIANALSTFAAPPMRLQVRRIGRMTLIDDSYNANPSSTGAAIDVLRSVNHGRRVFVAGDMLELGQASAQHHEETGQRIAESGVDVLVAVGQYAQRLIQGAQSINRDVKTMCFDDTESACRELPGRLTECDTVLIKGSRHLRLERLARSIADAFA